MQVQQINITSVIPSKTNPRKDFNQVDQSELIESIKISGIQTPLMVRSVETKEKGVLTYEIIDGERRHRAALDIHLQEVPCIIVEMSDTQAVDAQLISHLQRKNIHPMEEANAFDQFLGKIEITGEKARRKMITELAKNIGKPESHIVQRLKLLDLIKEAQSLYTKNVITIEHATLLAKMTPEDQARSLNWLVNLEDSHVVAKDVRVFKDWIAEEISLNLNAAPFDKADENLISGVPSCLLCPKNSGYNTALFPELSKKHVCGDRTCFTAKVAAHLAQQKAIARKEQKMGFIMISTRQLDMDDPLKVDGVKMHGRYKVVTEKNKCDDTKKAQYIDGPDKGKYVLVCNYGKCQKHFKERANMYASHSSSDHYNSPKNIAKREAAEKEMEERIKFEQLFRGDLANEIKEKMPKKVSLELVKLLLVRTGTSHSKIAKMSEAQLSAFILERLMHAELEVQRWSIDNKPQMILHLAQSCKINVKKLRKIHEAEQAKQEKLESKKEQPAKKGKK